jgi:MFS family permease
MVRHPGIFQRMIYKANTKSSAAFQPLYGQLANLWGRRYVMIGTTCIFLLGSGLCGGATSINMLIGGRAVQGIGAGGINMLIDMIICDLVPMRERASLMGLLFLTISIGTTIGPFIGALLTAHATWRWIFYLNLPLGGLALALLVLFLQVEWKSEGTAMERLQKVDFPGNAMLMGSTFAILWALTYGGTKYSWSAASVVIPLVMGMLGFMLFVFFEMSRFCPYPVMPTQHFTNRTSAAAFLISFMCMLVTFWVIYFYPIYFQAVLGVSITRSGVLLLPITIGFPIFAAVGGAVVTATGRYKPIHIFSGAMFTIGMGTSSILNQNTHIGVFAVLELILSIGMGLTVSSTLQAVQAGLPESEVGSSTGTWSFIRSLGTIWGVAIPAAIFNNRFDQLSGQIDPSISQYFKHGLAYQNADAKFRDSFPAQFRPAIIDAYVGALKRVWLIGILFTIVIFLASFLEKEIVLRTELDTEYGLKNGNGEKALEEFQEGGQGSVENEEHAH